MEFFNFLQLPFNHPRLVLGVNIRENDHVENI